MGISSLSGIQFMHRLAIFFMPSKYQPDYKFLRNVQTKKVHIFTLIQILSIAMLFLIKSYKIISIAFPIMVLALVGKHLKNLNIKKFNIIYEKGIRKIMDYVLFTQSELSHLDDIMPEISKRSNEECKNNQNNNYNKKV